MTSSGDDTLPPGPVPRYVSALRACNAVARVLGEVREEAAGLQARCAALSAVALDLGQALVTLSAEVSDAHAMAVVAMGGNPDTDDVDAATGALLPGVWPTAKLRALKAGIVLSG